MYGFQLDHVFTSNWNDKMTCYLISCSVLYFKDQCTLTRHCKSENNTPAFITHSVSYHVYV